jgi:hypothetical protein
MFPVQSVSIYIRCYAASPVSFYKRTPLFPANARAIYSAEGSADDVCGRSYRPRANRRNSPLAVRRDNVLSTAARLPRPVKSTRLNTLPLFAMSTRARIAASMLTDGFPLARLGDFAALADRTEIVSMKEKIPWFSDKRNQNCSF